MDRRRPTSLRPVVVASATLGAAVGVFARRVRRRRRRPPAARSPRPARCRCSCSPGRRSSAPSASSPPAARRRPRSAAAMLLAARNGVYGLAMSRIVGGSLATRLVAAQLDDRRVDGDGRRPSRRPRPSGPRSGSPARSIFVCWNLGTLVGALAGVGHRPEDVRPRRRLPGRLRGHGGAAPAHTASACSPGCSARAICLVLDPVHARSASRSCAPSAAVARRRSRPARRRGRTALPGTAGAPMTWTLVLLLGAGAYACKVIGLVVIGSRHLPPVVERCLALVPAALISALDRQGHVLDRPGARARRPRRRRRRRPRSRRGGGRR